jgi:flagellar basal-body rod protein FlgF
VPFTTWTHTGRRSDQALGYLVASTNAEAFVIMNAPDGLAAAAEGMRIQADALGVIASNLANTSTAGYRPRVQALAPFSDELHTQIEISGSQGPLRRTGVATDLALAGPGYFALATPAGVRYTRDGRVTVDPRGFLADARGNYLLGSLGPVAFPHGAHIDEAGRVMVGGNAVDRLRIVDFDRPCESDETGLLAVPAKAIPTRARASVRPGYLEDSGVDAIEQMTALITAQRAYEADEKAALQTDERLRRLAELPVLRS